MSDLRRALSFYFPSVIVNASLIAGCAAASWAVLNWISGIGG